MIYLLLCIVSSTLIFVVFKFLDKYKIPVLPVIVYNYLFASTTGFLLSGNNLKNTFQTSSDWLSLSILIGILFIIMFFIVGKSSEKAGISVTTVASKMSFITPVGFSILIDPTDSLTTLKTAGILIALIAVFLTIYRKKTHLPDVSAVWYPVVLFLGMGLVDSLVKYSQQKYIEDTSLPLFSAILFLIAFLTGCIILLAGKKGLRRLIDAKVLFWGLVLGLSNYGSIYFIIRSLNYKPEDGQGIDSSVVFGINNIGIVMLSVLAGLVLFKEKLTRLNLAGIVLSVIAIIVFAYA